jgi:hypothetical protein
MKTIKQIVLWSFAFCFIHACDDKPETTAVESVKNVVGTSEVDVCCLASYEILENGDTVNRIYGKEKVKDGRWITFVMIDQQEKQTDKATAGAAVMVRTKMEEGRYRQNKRQGYWKLYNRYGTVRDSVEYKNDVPVVN